MKKMLILLMSIFSVMVATDVIAIDWQKRCVQDNEQEIDEQIKRMEESYHTGEIDVLMLKRLVMEKDYTTVEESIKYHMFSGYFEIYPPIYFQKPFVIEHRCIKNDGSELSDKVFKQIYRTNVLELGLMIKNPLNQQNYSVSNVIDECTTFQSIQDSEDVLVTSKFYNKQALRVALNKLKN